MTRPAVEAHGRIDTGVQVTVERADAEVSLVLQEAFFADIAARYPGWEPASSQSVGPSDLAPPGGIWLVAYRDGRARSAAAGCNGSTLRSPRSGGSSSTRTSAVMGQGADWFWSSRSMRDVSVISGSGSRPAMGSRRRSGCSVRRVRRDPAVHRRCLHAPLDGESASVTRARAEATPIGRAPRSGECELPILGPAHARQANRLSVLHLSRPAGLGLG